MSAPAPPPQRPTDPPSDGPERQSAAAAPAPDRPGGRPPPDAAGRRSLGRGIWLFAREVAIVVGLAMVLALVAKTWFVQSFYIPSGSMLNTLAEDDRVIVSKLTPGPFELSRGDIVVFEDPGHWLPTIPEDDQSAKASGAVATVLTWVGLLPSDSGTHLIKRVIGLPGDRVACCGQDGRITVNGAAITETYLHPGDDPSSQPFDISVPAGKVWVMGDHRSDSADSRFNDTAEAATNVMDPTTATDPRNKTGYYGSVPIDRVVGRAVAIILPLSKVSLLSTPGEAFAKVPAPARVSPQTPARTPAPASTPASGRAASVPVAAGAL